jgi:uncharacterized damage-inducible protein DinB
MRRPVQLLLLLLLLPAVASAQQGDDSVMESSRQLYEAGKRFVTGVAEQSPEQDYAYRPAETVRTLGQVLGHLADVHFLTCSIALGEQNPNAGSVEQANPAKAEMVATLRRSYEYCDRAYAQNSQALAAAAELFGQQTTRFHALNLNVSHDFEHYGNLVTYVRMRGRVPPSSQQ